MIHPDDMGPLATMADAHLEWHLNAGVPVGQPGCPQDACHLPDPWCWECFDEAPDTCPECIEAAAASAAWLAAQATEVDPWAGTPFEAPPF